MLLSQEFFILGVSALNVEQNPIVKCGILFPFKIRSPEVIATKDC